MEWWNQGASNRTASVVYDIVLAMIAIWFVVVEDPWVPWTAFVLANLAGLFVFNNIFARRRLTLVHRWRVIGILLAEVGLYAWIVSVHDPRRVAMTVVGLSVVVAVRLCFRSAEVAGAARLPRTDSP